MLPFLIPIIISSGNKQDSKQPSKEQIKKQNLVFLIIIEISLWLIAISLGWTIITEYLL